MFCFFKQKTAYEMRISDWSSDVCSSDLELLLEKGYEVHGIKRRASLFNTQRVDHIYQDPHELHARFVLHYGDLTDSSNLTRIMQQVQPDEVYNLGAQSHVAVSFESPE